jgi:hypothetical protein
MASSRHNDGRLDPNRVDRRARDPVLESELTPHSNHCEPTPRHDSPDTEPSTTLVERSLLAAPVRSDVPNDCV